MKNRILSPSLAVAVLALFVALGGSALAVTAKKKPLVPCANGTIKGSATFDLDHVSGSLSSDFSSDPHWFKARYDCTGAAPQIRSANGVIEIRFPGLNINAATASVYSDSNRGSADVSIVSGDTVRVYTIDGAGNPAARGFSLIVS
jgi:hypothetical protein